MQMMHACTAADNPIEPEGCAELALPSTLSATCAMMKRGMSQRRLLFGFLFLDELGSYLKAGADCATDTICKPTAECLLHVLWARCHACQEQHSHDRQNCHDIHTRELMSQAARLRHAKRTALPSNHMRYTRDTG